MRDEWLPPLVLFGGDWDVYEEEIYNWFRRDFVESKPAFPNHRVALKRLPMFKNKEATFWHFISAGPAENDRVPDMRRCERIRWPKPIIESYTEQPSVLQDRIVWWKNCWRSSKRCRFWSVVLNRYFNDKNSGSTMATAF